MDDHKIEIHGEGMTSSGYKVLMDGKDISKKVRHVKVEMGIDQVNVCTISFIPTEVEVTGDFVVDDTPDHEQVEVTGYGDKEPQYMPGEPKPKKHIPYEEPRTHWLTEKDGAR